jgi:hypothetical protein
VSAKAVFKRMTFVDASCAILKMLVLPLNSTRCFFGALTGLSRGEDGARGTDLISRVGMEIMHRYLAAPLRITMVRAFAEPPIARFGRRAMPGTNLPW